MRVLMIHPHDIYSPLEPWTIRITALARSLTKLGHEVKVVYHISDPQQLPGDLRHRQEFPFEVVPLIRHMGLGFRKSRAISDLASWADIIHVQKSLAHAALPAAAAALRGGAWGWVGQGGVGRGGVAGAVWFGVVWGGAEWCTMLCVTAPPHLIRKPKIG